MELATSDVQKQHVHGSSLNCQAERLKGVSGEIEVEIPSDLLRTKCT